MPFQKRLQDLLDLVDAEQPEALPVTRAVSAWVHLKEAKDRFAEITDSDNAKQFKDLPWYPIGFGLMGVLTWVEINLLTMVRVTTAGSVQRRRNLDTLSSTFRSVMNSDPCREFRRRFPAAYRSALFVALTRVEQTFDAMLLAASDAGLDEPEFQRLVCVDVHDAMDMLVRLIENEPVDQIDRPDEEGFHFVGNRAVSWGAEPLDLYAAERAVLHVLSDRLDEIVPYGDLEAARTDSRPRTLALRTAEGLRPIVSRINKILREVQCPYEVQNKRKEKGYMLTLRKSTTDAAEAP